MLLRASHDAARLSYAQEAFAPLLELVSALT